MLSRSLAPTGLRPNFWGAVWLVLAIHLVAALAFSQEDPNAPEPPPTEQAPARAESYVNAPPFPEATLIPRWRIFREAPVGSEERDRAFETLMVTSYELGLTDLPGYSLVLLQESRYARGSGDVGTADALASRAASLSPNDPSRQFARARDLWGDQPLNVMGWVGAARQGYDALYATVAGRAKLEVLWRVAVLRWWGVLSVMLGMGFFIRHAGQAAFDLRVLTRQVLTLGQARLLVVVLVLAPAVILSSPVLLLLVAVMVVAPYLSWVERPLAVALAAGFVFAPQLAQEAAQARAIEQSMGQYVSTAMTSTCDARCQERLAGASEQGNSTAQLAYGWVRFRQDGTWHADEIRAVAPVDAQAPGVRSSAYVLLGSLAFVEDDMESARAHYERALTLASTPAQLAAANFNLYRVAERIGDDTLAQSSLLAATRTQSELVDRFRTYPGRNQNRLLMQSPLPTEEAYAAELAQVNPEVAALVLEDGTQLWFGELKTATAMLLLYGLLGVLVLSAPLYQRRLAAGRCRDCATPTSKLVYENAHQMGLCVMCYQLRAHSGQLTYHQRVARERRVERWRALSPRLQLFANIVFPGLGFTAGGWPAVGAGFALVIASAVTLMWADVSQLSLPYSLADEHLFFAVHTVGLMLFVAAWLACSIAALLAIREQHA